VWFGQTLIINELSWFFPYIDQQGAHHVRVQGLASVISWKGIHSSHVNSDRRIVLYSIGSRGRHAGSSGSSVLISLCGQMIHGFPI